MQKYCGCKSWGQQQQPSFNCSEHHNLPKSAGVMGRKTKQQFPYFEAVDVSRKPTIVFAETTFVRVSFCENKGQRRHYFSNVFHINNIKEKFVIYAVLSIFVHICAKRSKQFYKYCTTWEHKRRRKNTDSFTLYVQKKNIPSSRCAKQNNIPTSITASIWKIYTETKIKSGSATNNCKKETVTLKCHKNVRTVVIYRITVCTNPHAVNGCSSRSIELQCTLKLIQWLCGKSLFW